MSEPDTNADSPAPVMMMTPASSLPASSPSASRHSSTVSRFSAFLTAGRSIVSVAIESDRSTRILIHAPTHLAAEPAGLDVLDEQRTRTVLLAERPMQIFENAEARVEADQIDQLERAHRMIQSEFERLVDVFGRRDALHQHIERFVADAGVDARGDEPRRFTHEHGVLAH